MQRGLVGKAFLQQAGVKTQDIAGPSLSIAYDVLVHAGQN